jgi:integrase
MNVALLRWQDVRIWDVQDRRSDPEAKRPWVVRWAVDGRQRGRTFRTRSEAEHFRSALLLAKRLEERFDPDTAQPVSWLPVAGGVKTHVWARRWVAEQWLEWQPRTRASAIEALARLIPLVTADGAGMPKELRGYLVRTLQPSAEIDATHECERWLESAVLPLDELSRERVAIVDSRLGVGDNGQLLSPATASRFRKVARACLRRAVDLEVIERDTWPPARKGRSQRKSMRTTKAVDVRRLPSPATMAVAIDAIETQHPGSRKYRVMTAVAYYGGLRPSEVVMLRGRSLTLPDVGWGRIDVTEADVDLDEPGEPKTGSRVVPIPPVLVGMLREWLGANGFDSPEELIFRTHNNRRPTFSNWGRAWHRALRQVGQPTIRVYDCRHAAATTWLRAGVPLGEVARRLGHSVETLVSTYVGAIEDDEHVANERIEVALIAHDEHKPDQPVSRVPSVSPKTRDESVAAGTTAPGQPVSHAP